MRIAAGEAVRRVDVEDADRRQRDQVAQALQGGADQAGAAVAIVDEQHGVLDAVAVPRGARRQVAQLAIDGVPLGLLVGRDPGVDRHTRRGRRRDDSQLAGPHGELPSVVSQARPGLTGGRGTAAGVRRRAPTRPGAAPGLVADLQAGRSALLALPGHGGPHPRPVWSAQIGVAASTRSRAPGCRDVGAALAGSRGQCRARSLRHCLAGDGQLPGQRDLPLAACRRGWRGAPPNS